MKPVRGAIASPNIWQHTATYETENRAADPDGRLWAAMEARADWADKVVLDLGCGTGFHLPRFAATAARVIGVEPHPGLIGIARRRTRALTNVDLLPGTAQEIPLPDTSVDVVHARWAYFFGRGCEPGLVELDRVLRWLADELDLADRVHFLGHVSHPLRVIADSDVYVMSSREEGLGTSVLDAMARESPLLAAPHDRAQADRSGGTR